MSTVDGTQLFYISGIKVDPSKNQIEKDNLVVAVQPKVMAVLIYLAQNSDRVVSADELIKNLWDNRVVSYGTVPKAITSLRKALGEFLGNEEVIANYSKKGYQLLISAEIEEKQCTNSNKADVLIYSAQQNNFNHRFLNFRMLAIVFVFILSFTLIYFSKNTIDKSHRTIFHNVVGFTNETGHERIAEPHPDNQHVVYMRDTFKTEDLTQNDSTLAIRSTQGAEWEVDTTSGNWYRVTWSPSATQLLAVEVERHKDKLLTKNFYETADFYYTIFVFDIDLKNQKVLKKEMVNRWQGRIYSTSWYNDTTIELVARQGVSGKNKRYRINLNNGKSVQEVLSKHIFLTPLASSTHENKSAVAYRNGNLIDVVLFDEKDNLVTKGSFRGKTVDLSWIPDKSGVAIYLDYKILNLLYLNGETTPVKLPHHKDRVTYRPRYSYDGNSIYITEKRFKTNIFNYPLSGFPYKLTNNDSYNYLSRYSIDGEGVLYVSVRNNQVQIWLIRNRNEQQVVALDADRVKELFWHSNDEFIYKIEKGIFVFNIVKKTNNLLLQSNHEDTPILWLPEHHVLIVSRYSNDQVNLWSIDLKTKMENQLTFGSLGAIRTNKNNIYFQYKNKDGLWITSLTNPEPKLLFDEFPKNTKLLAIDDTGVYFIQGGDCRESDVKYFDFISKKVNLYQTRDKTLATSSFHPKKGSLGWRCYLAESNVLRYY